YSALRRNRKKATQKRQRDAASGTCESAARPDQGLRMQEHGSVLRFARRSIIVGPSSGRPTAYTFAHHALVLRARGRVRLRLIRTANRRRTETSPAVCGFDYWLSCAREY